MDTFDTATNLITKDCFMASLDLKDAYYSVPIACEHRKYLKFFWKDKLYQFKALCNGLASGPRIFTKLLKPPFATLRSHGYQIIGYIDDSLLVSPSKEEAEQAVAHTKHILTSLGFIVHPEKSIFNPCKEIQFLGFIINSGQMTVRLPQNKKESLKYLCMQIEHKKYEKIRVVAEVTGKIVATFPASQIGKLHYRSLEKAKTKALKENKGDFDKLMEIDSSVKQELRWWIENVDSCIKMLTVRPISKCLESDASGLGWGATDGCSKIGGQWNPLELEYAVRNEINYLELLASFLGLQSFCNKEMNIHIHLKMDNITAVTYINNMGGTKSVACNRLAKQIWQWCLDRQIWLTASHLPGEQNCVADYESRHFQTQTEWMLDVGVFQDICKIVGKPDIDIFASRLNAQLPRYFSWKPDPGAEAVDALAQDWGQDIVYAFPPFCLISTCLRKIVHDKAEGIMVVPKWATQPWFAKLLSMLTAEPIILPRSKYLLTKPGTKQHHPLHDRMFLLCCRVSGLPSKAEIYRRTLKTYSWQVGESPHRNSMQHTSGSGVNFVCNGKLIRCRPMSI